MMITIGKHVADFKQAWFRRSMHISFIKDPRPCGCRWLASKSLFPIVGISAPASGIKEISDLPPTQHHYTDHSEESTPFGNQTMQNPWKIHGKSENPWKIHGKSMEHPKIHGKSMENPWKFQPSFRVSEIVFLFGRQQFPSIRCGLTFPAEATLIFEDQNAVLLHVIFDPGQTKCDLDTLPPKISKMPC